MCNEVLRVEDFFLICKRVADKTNRHIYIYYEVNMYM
jgi:hypothetical protein